MPAAGAADADRHVGTLLGLEARQPLREELAHLLHVRLDLGQRHEVVAHVLVATRERAQALVPVRVRQAARVEHEIGIGRHAALVGERLEQQRQFVRGHAERRGHHAPQLVHVQLARIDHAVGDRDQRPQQAALERDRVGQREAVGGQRVAAARVGEALQQHLVARVEEHELVGDPGLRDLREHLRQPLQVLAAIAHVHADREARITPRLVACDRLHERRHERRRQVVDAVVAEVLERAQRHRLARAGQPAHDDQARRRHGRRARRGRRREALGGRRHRALSCGEARSNLA